MHLLQPLGKMMTATTTMGVKLDEDLKIRLKNLGKSRDRSPHWLMKKAIAEFLEREEALERRNREADEAFNEYLMTGESVSYQEMDAWLATWDGDEEGECPIMKS